jgi:type IV secretion system protein VirD4
MHPSGEDQVFALIVIATIVAVFVLSRRRWRGSGTAYGTASWMTEKMLRAAGMLGKYGLVLGRTFSGALIRLPDYCHILLTAGTGAGKGVSIILPNLFTYFRGSVVCFDTKCDLYATAGKRRAARGERILRLGPFTGGEDALNPLDTIPPDSPTLVDSAHAMATALVVRQESETDPHWNDKAIQLIRACLVLVLLRFKGEDRNLNSVQEIISDHDLLKNAVMALQDMGGIPARLGNQVKALFDRDDVLTKEGAGVLSTATRHLSFLDSELVGKAVNSSTFDPAELRKPGITLFLQIPPDQLDAQQGLLRCWISILVRVISAVGDEREGETLFLLDEASALGGLPAIEEALVRGRSSGVRMVLAYQSDSQVREAFKHKPTLLYDNCHTQIYLGAASNYETAERLSKSLGDWTQVVESKGDTESWQPGGGSQQGHVTRTCSINLSETGRALLRPEEILTLNNDYVIVLQRGMSPILANRVKWYEDPEFNPAATKRFSPARPWWRDLVTPIWRRPSQASVTLRLVAAAILGLILLALANR